MGSVQFIRGRIVAKIDSRFKHQESVSLGVKVIRGSLLVKVTISPNRWHLILMEFFLLLLSGTLRKLLGQFGFLRRQLSKNRTGGDECEPNGVHTATYEAN